MVQAYTVRMQTYTAQMPNCAAAVAPLWPQSLIEAQLLQQSYGSLSAGQLYQDTYKSNVFANAKTKPSKKQFKCIVQCLPMQTQHFTNQCVQFIICAISKNEKTSVGFLTF